MNTKRLTLSVLIAVAVGFAGLAEAASNSSAGQETAPPTMQPGGMDMMGQGGMGMMGMGSCPMSDTHLSGKDAMLMHADMLQAMSNIMRKYADRAKSSTER
ncbi:MAG: hypothetical protein EPN57_08125 [Paraburkholderia sp.]|nr:MAG: hypothetical protein EPN57_08125 [Paraburkholderia sp.]